LVYLVALVHLVSLVQPNKRDKPHKPNEQDRLVDRFSIPLSLHCLDKISQEDVAT
jgi:hypothetical protein